MRDTGTVETASADSLPAGTLPAATPLTLAISATFTADPLAAPLRFWSAELSWPLDPVFAPYNQLHQTILDPQSVFGRNRRGVNVLLLRLEDLVPRTGHAEPDLHELASAALELQTRVQETAGRLAVPLIITVCPSSAAFTSDAARASWQTRVEGEFLASLTSLPGLHVLSAEHIARLYPVPHMLDARSDEIGRIPYTEPYFAALATALVRHAHALLRPPKKVIVTDLDNTLWKGICGEDGPQGVVVDEPRRQLQQLLLQQRDHGLLLAIASKNNDSDAVETFRLNPEMPLQLRHFTARRVNWEPKPLGLEALARELNLGLDSFLFLDDSHKEAAEVAERLPQVTTIVLPEKIEELPHFLQHVWWFDHPAVTEADRQRAASYEATLAFSREAKHAASLAEFLASLHLHVELLPLSTGTLDRAAQLTQRTNQFNCTTRRRSTAELAEMLQTGVTEIAAVHVKDRFGDYGEVGLVIYESENFDLKVDTFLLSCRVLGRGVEHRMLEQLGELACQRNLERVIVPFSPTAKNAPARQFLESVGAPYRVDEGDRSLYCFPAAALQNLPVEGVPVPHEEPALSDAVTAVPASAHDITQRMVELSSVSSLIAAMSARAGAEAVLPPSTHPPGTDTERQLLAIWSALLERPVGSVEESFFDLGGHSLLVVLLLTRIRESFGVELSIDNVYSGSLTVAELARQIESAQLSQLDTEEYAALLADIETMSDEEVRRLLEQEGGH